MIMVLATYFVEWIPNATAAPAASPGEFPWQLGHFQNCGRAKALHQDDGEGTPTFDMLASP
jgi:hypothetical protein